MVLSSSNLYVILCQSKAKSFGERCGRMRVHEVDSINEDGFLADQKLIFPLVRRVQKLHGQTLLGIDSKALTSPYCLPIFRRHLTWVNYNDLITTETHR